LRAPENRVLRRIFEPKREEVAGGWRRLHNEELHNLYTSPNIIRVITLTGVGLAGHVARIGEMRNVYIVLVGNRKGKRPLGRPRRKWEGNTQMHFLGIEWDGVD
jgi:hypothetical protein